MTHPISQCTCLLFYCPLAPGFSRTVGVQAEEPFQESPAGSLSRVRPTTKDFLVSRAVNAKGTVSTPLAAAGQDAPLDHAT